MGMFESSNPALAAGKKHNYVGIEDSKVATFQGVADKAAMLTGLTMLAGAAAYAFLPAGGSVTMISCVAAMIVGIGIYFVLAGNPAKARILAPIYAIVEGAWLGLLTRSLDAVAINMGLDVSSYGSLAMPALIITICCVVSLLALYRLGIIKPTAKFKAVVVTLTMAVMLTYLVMFVLYFFGIEIPYISLSSATGAGNAPLIGLGINAAILILASLFLVIDFAAVQEMVESGQPKYMEWFGGFILLVTLAWIYYEAVKLAFRLAVMFQSDD